MLIKELEKFNHYSVITIVILSIIFFILMQAIYLIYT